MQSATISGPSSFLFDFGLLPAAAAGLHTVVCFLVDAQAAAWSRPVSNFREGRGGKSCAGDSNVVNAFTSLFLSFFPLFFGAAGKIAFISRRQQIYGLSRLINCSAAAAKFWTERQFRRRKEGRKERSELETEMKLSCRIEIRRLIMRLLRDIPSILPKFRHFRRQCIHAVEIAIFHSFTMGAFLTE